MKPKWLIEDFEADNKFDLLAEEVKKQGMEVEIVKYIPLESGNYNKYGKNECVIVQSSLNLATQLQRQKGWIPGPWLNSGAYQCTEYYPFLGKYLMNKDYVMLPRAEVKRKWPQLLKIFGNEYEGLFLRPSSGHKTFTGHVFQTEHLEKDYEWVDEFTDPQSIIIISSVKEIEKEWRFVCADHQIITGSLYKQRIGGVVSSGKYREIPTAIWQFDDDDINIQEDYSAFEFAGQVAFEEYDCDPMYTIDICKTADGEFHLLEIGSYSCAGLYDCNIEILVKKATEIAIREWYEYYPKNNV